MVYPSGRFLGSIVPFVHRSPAIASIIKTPIAAPKTLKPRAKRINIPLPSFVPSLHPHLHGQRTYTRKHPQPIIDQACRRSFGNGPEKKHSHPYPLSRLAAGLYDLLNGPLPVEEVDFYRGLITDQEKVLVVGSGTGQLLLALIGRGLKVDGIEPSQPMRDICMSKALENQQEALVYSQSMETLNLRSRYGSIFVPNETFMSILNENKALETLKNFRSHLEPGGQLVIELLLPSMGNEVIKNYNHSIVRDLDGKQISCEIQYQWNAIKKWRRGCLDIEFSENGKLDHCQIEHSKIRLYSAEEFKEMLERAGFVDIKELRSVSLSHEEDKITFQAKKAADLFDNSKLE